MGSPRVVGHARLQHGQTDGQGLPRELGVGRPQQSSRIKGTGKDVRDGRGACAHTCACVCVCLGLSPAKPSSRLLARVLTGKGSPEGSSLLSTLRRK